MGCASYKGYSYFSREKKSSEGEGRSGIHVQYMIKHHSVNPHLPRSFTWTAPHDLAGLHYYIDGLIDGVEQTLAYYEDQGFVQDIVHCENKDVEVITINPPLLLSVLRGEYPIKLDKTANVVIRTFCNEYMTSTFPAALADESLLPFYYQTLHDRIKNGKHIITPKRLKTKGKPGKPLVRQVDLKHPSVNIDEADKQLPAPEYNTEFTYPFETFVSQRECPDHLEVVTHVLLEDHSHYYCKRYYNRQDEVVKTETSWDGVQWRTMPPEKVDAA